MGLLLILDRELVDEEVFTGSGRGLVKIPWLGILITGAVRSAFHAILGYRYSFDLRVMISFSGIFRGWCVKFVLSFFES
jgi:hypothetical protein